MERVIYRYLLDLEIDGSDQSNLIDSLEDEELPLRDLIGEPALVAGIKDGTLHLDHETDKPFPGFAESLATISIHISEYVTGLEIAEARNEHGSRVSLEILKHVARLGDRIAVPLSYTIAFPSGEIRPGEEDIGHLERSFRTLPRWAQDAYRIKFPSLRRL